MNVTVRELFPVHGQKSIINSRPKNSDEQSKGPFDHRGIELTSAMYKLFCDVLNNRIKYWVNNLLCDEQMVSGRVGTVLTI